MVPFESTRPERAEVGPSRPSDSIEIVDAAGNGFRYASDDFDELLETSDAREMRRYLGLGWLLLDERVGRCPGRSASWLDAALRRSAGRVLAAQDDPQHRPAEDVTTYVLGHLQPGAFGAPAG
jgi:hypothetical protein